MILRYQSVFSQQYFCNMILSSISLRHCSPIGVFIISLLPLHFGTSDHMPFHVEPTSELSQIVPQTFKSISTHLFDQALKKAERLESVLFDWI